MGEEGRKNTNCRSLRTWLKRTTDCQRGHHVLRSRNCHIPWPRPTQVVIILAFFQCNVWAEWNGGHEVQGSRLQLTRGKAKMCQPRQGMAAKPWFYIWGMTFAFRSQELYVKNFVKLLSLLVIYVYIYESAQWVKD